MTKHDRYKTSHLVEVQFEPGSGKRVLKNLPGIKRKREMDEMETEALDRATAQLVRIYDRGHRFKESDIKYIHKLWLSEIYEWAGEYRQVNIGKGDFLFAAAIHVPDLIKEFAKTVLYKHTPCNFKSSNRVIRSLAEVHTEFLLIHPFREGNGRVARLLSMLMALQAGLPPLDFRDIKGKKRKEYFLAVQAGMDKEYTSMEAIFSGVVRRTLQVHGLL